MAIKLHKGPSPTQVNQNSQPAQQASPQPAPVQQAVQKTKAPAQTGGTPAFMHKGSNAMAIFEQEEARKAKAAKGQTYRFWVAKDNEAQITFLDGDMVNGMLDAVFFYEHNVNLNGKWGNYFICTQETEPCPICEGGASPSYVAALTVIDHSSYISKTDGKEHSDNQKLFVAKADTYKLLQKIAAKRDGLRGCTFDVMRTGDKSAAVGSAFDFTEKRTPAQLKQAYTITTPTGKIDKSIPVNYESMLTDMYLTAAELRKMGFGSSAAPIGSESSPEEFENQL